MKEGKIKDRDKYFLDTREDFVIELQKLVKKFCKNGKPLTLKELKLSLPTPNRVELGFVVDMILPDEQIIFKKEYFKTMPRWQIFIWKLFGRKTNAYDSKNSKSINADESVIAMRYTLFGKDYFEIRK